METIARIHRTLDSLEPMLIAAPANAALRTRVNELYAQLAALGA